MQKYEKKTQQQNSEDDSSNNPMINNRMKVKDRARIISNYNVLTVWSLYTLICKKNNSFGLKF